MLWEVPSGEQWDAEEGRPSGKLQKQSDADERRDGGSAQKETTCIVSICLTQVTDPALRSQMALGEPGVEKLTLGLAWKRKNKSNQYRSK